MAPFLILLLIILASILLLISARSKRRIKHWRQTLALDSHEVIFNNLYANVDGFQLSRRARAENDAMEYVYGEIDFESFIALLSLCKPHSDSIFYDLGSGIGKAVLACAMVFKVRKSYGIELFEQLHQCANTQHLRLAAIPEYTAKSTSISFQQGDFRTISLSDANIVFINASAFFGQFWIDTSRHLEQLQPGAMVISTSKALASTAFETQHITVVTMSWGVVNVYIQQRLPVHIVAG